MQEHELRALVLFVMSTIFWYRTVPKILDLKRIHLFFKEVIVYPPTKERLKGILSELIGFTIALQIVL